MTADIDSLHREYITHKSCDLRRDDFRRVVNYLITSEFIAIEHIHNQANMDLAVKMAQDRAAKKRGMNGYVPNGRINSDLLKLLFKEDSE